MGVEASPEHDPALAPLQWLRRQWIPIPLSEGTKDNPLVDWKQYQQKCPSEEEVRRWASKWPSANWAIVTGATSQLVVLDVDSVVGERLLGKLDLPVGLTVTTKKGRHIYLRHPGGKIQNAAPFLPGIDLRADGGYVLAPPSRHPDGGNYEWVDAPEVVEVADCPEWLLQLLANREARHVVCRELNRVLEAKEGARNDQLNKSAFAVAHQVAQGAVSEEAARGLLAQIATEAGLGDSEIRSTIQSAFEAGCRLKNPRGQSLSLESRTEAVFKLYGIDELANLPAPKWLVESILPEGALAELYGQPGVGKSFLALGLALSVASGTPWLGRVVSPHNVVYVCAEGHRGLRKRVDAWQSDNGGVDLEHFKTLPESINFRDSAEVCNLIASVQNQVGQIGLIVIDTLARCFGDGDENSTKDMSGLVANIDRFRSAFPEATVLVVHHSGKDTSKGDRGSTALRGAADSIVELRGSSSNLLLRCKKQKDWEPFEDLALRLDAVQLGNGETSCVLNKRDSLGAPLEKRLAKSQEKALGVLRDTGELGATGGEWRSASKLNGERFPIVRDELIAAGSVVESEGRFFVADSRSDAEGGHGQKSGHFRS